MNDHDDTIPGNIRRHPRVDTRRTDRSRTSGRRRRRPVRRRHDNRARRPSAQRVGTDRLERPDDDAARHPCRRLRGVGRGHGPATVLPRRRGHPEPHRGCRRCRGAGAPAQAARHRPALGGRSGTRPRRLIPSPHTRLRTTRPVRSFGVKNVDFGGISAPSRAVRSISATLTGRISTAAVLAPDVTASTTWTTPCW